MVLSLVIAAIGIVYIAIESKMSRKKKVVASILLMAVTVCQIYFYNACGVFNNTTTTDCLQEDACDDEDAYEDDYDYDYEYNDNEDDYDYSDDKVDLTSYNELTSDINAKKNEIVMMEGYVVDCQITEEGYVCIVQIEGIDDDMVIIYADYSVCKDNIDEGYWVVFKGISAGYLKYDSTLGVISAPAITVSSISAF